MTNAVNPAALCRRHNEPMTRVPRFDTSINLHLADGDDLGLLHPPHLSGGARQIVRHRGASSLPMK